MKSIKRLRRCSCPASDTDKGMKDNWKLVKRKTATVWIIRCQACKAVWESSAKYVEGLGEQQ